MTNPSDKIGLPGGFEISRRHLMIAAGAAGAVFVAGAGVAVYNDADRLYRRTIRKLAPGVKVRRGDWDKFEDAFRVRMGDSLAADAKHRFISIVSGVAGDWAFNLAGLGLTLEWYERFAVTSFFENSDYHYLPDPTSDEVSFTGPNPTCGNPFARFA